MALDSHMWAPASAMPMAESALYRQRLEVIAEKRRLQEAIRAARRELDEEKLRVQRLKRKSLRDRWLMDGAAEEPEDPPTPETQAQARIQNLEGSLFTLQAQLQLLQSASTGALHRPVSKPTWRRQGQRPLSQPPVEPGHAGQADQDKRASLPAGLADVSPECPEPGQVPGAAGVSSEVNGPRLEPPNPTPGVRSEGSPGDVMEVVWEGLRDTEDGAAEPTGAELEAKVEAMVLEAIEERLDSGGPDLPVWVRDDRNVVEVVWEGLGGDLEAPGEPGGSPEAEQPSVPRLLEGLRRGSPDGAGHGGRGGEDGAFIWVERVTVTEDWEELGLEGTEGAAASDQDLGLDGGAASCWELERRQAEEQWRTRKGSENVPEVETSGDEPMLAGEEGATRAEREMGGQGPQAAEAARHRETGEAAGGSPGTPTGEGDTPLQVERGGEELPEEDRGGGEELSQASGEGGEEVLKAQRGGEESPRTDRGGGEELPKAEEGGEEPPEPDRGGEERLKTDRGGEESPKVDQDGGEEFRGGEELLRAPSGGGEDLSQAEEQGGEEFPASEEPRGLEKDVSTREGACGGGKEGQAEAVGEEGVGQEAREEPTLEEEVQSPQKMEDCLEAEAACGKPLRPAEGLPSAEGSAMPLLEVTPVPTEQSPECQPLLQGRGPRTNPSAHPVPSYAPARQPVPSAAAPEGSEASAPKQKTCQCCAVM